MADPQYIDLKEHISSVVELLILFAGIAGFLFWRSFVRVEKKVDDIGAWILGSQERCADCKKDFLTIKAFDDWKQEFLEQFKEWRQGRDGPGGLWETINRIREKIGL